MSPGFLSGDSYLVGVGGGGQWVHSAVDLKDHRRHAAQAAAVDVKLKTRGRSSQKGRGCDLTAGSRQSPRWDLCLCTAAKKWGGTCYSEDPQGGP